MRYDLYAAITLGIIFVFGMTRLITEHREKMRSLENEAKMTMQMQYPLADEKPWYKIF
jgi:hypothetical protein